MWYEGVRSAHIMFITVKKYACPPVSTGLNTEVGSFQLALIGLITISYH